MTSDSAAAYVVTSGSSDLLARTRASLGGVVQVLEVPFSALDAEAAVLTVSVEGSSPCVVLFEGEAVSPASLMALAGGERMRRDPQLLDVPSVAPDPFRRVLRRAAGSGGGAEGTPCAPVEPREEGAAWSVETAQLPMRRTAGSRAWAERRALALTQHQAAGRQVDDAEIGELLLFAGHWDAATHRALTRLQERLDPTTAAVWARIGLASAACTERWPEAAVFLERWKASDGGPVARSLQSWWSAVVATSRGGSSSDLADAGRGGVDVTVCSDPWQVAQLAATREHRRESAAVLAEKALRAAPSAHGDQEHLVELWRLAQLDAERLVADWPGSDVSVLYHGLVTSGGRDFRWWLEVAEALLRRRVIPEVITAASSVAARSSLEAAVQWTGVATDARVGGPSALHQRALDTGLAPLARVVAAACAVVASGNDAKHLLSAVVPLLHDSELERALLDIDAVAPGALSTVLELFCSDPARVRTAQAVLRRLGADEQADALAHSVLARG